MLFLVPIFHPLQPTNATNIHLYNIASAVNSLSHRVCNSSPTHHPASIWINMISQYLFGLVKSQFILLRTRVCRVIGGMKYTRGGHSYCDCVTTSAQKRASSRCSIFKRRNAKIKVTFNKYFNSLSRRNVKKLKMKDTFFLYLRNRYIFCIL